MMTDEFKDLIKIDFPDVEIDSKKIISVCKTRKDKYNKKIIKLTCILSSFIALVIIALLTIVLLSNKISNDVIRINKSIDKLELIDNDEEKMLRIMEIQKEIQNVSLEKKENINVSKLSYETTKTVNNLKCSVSWNSELNNDITYYPFSLIINNLDITEIYAIKGLNSNTKIRVTGKESIDALTSFFNLPYINIISDNETFYDKYASELSGDSKDYCNFQVIFGENTSDSLFNIYVYGSGYVLLSTTIKEGDNEKITNMYISLVPLDYSDFKLTYGAYSIISDLYFYEIVNFDDIKSISITESTYWALLGMPSTFINGEQMFEYYDSKLKNLNFIENDELVESIQRELGNSLDNDSYSITIALYDNDTVSIFVSKTTHRFIIAHGIMTYAGVSTIDFE